MDRFHFLEKLLFHFVNNRGKTIVFKKEKIEKRRNRFKFLVRQFVNKGRLFLIFYDC